LKEKRLLALKETKAALKRFFGWQNLIEEMDGRRELSERIVL